MNTQKRVVVLKHDTCRLKVHLKTNALYITSMINKTLSFLATHCNNVKSLLIP